jgi:hypothetical protein
MVSRDDDAEALARVFAMLGLVSFVARARERGAAAAEAPRPRAALCILVERAVCAFLTRARAWLIFFRTAAQARLLRFLRPILPVLSRWNIAIRAPALPAQACPQRAW